MNTSALGAILGAVALACVGIVYLKVDDLSDQIQALSRSTSDRVVETGEPEIERTRSYRDGTHPRVRDVAADETVADAPEARPAGTIEDRIARLEKAEAKRRKGMSDMPFHSMRMKTPVRSVDNLATRLKLTPTQKDRIADAVKRGKQRIDDILKIPDDSGKSPFQRRKEQREKLMEAIKNRDNGNVVAFATDMLSHRNKKIPGRNTTYGEEIKRVQQETKAEIEQSLNPEQKEQLKETNIDPMLGGGGGAMTMSVWSHGDDSGEEEGAVVVGESIAVGMEVDASEAPAKTDDD